MAEAKAQITNVSTDVEDRLSSSSPDEAHMSKLCENMFTRAGDYLRGEFESTADEYQLLEKMNRATIAKYAEMKDISANINIAVKNLDDKYNSLQPYLEMIDQVEESVTSLEQAAYKLDAYAKRLEAKFKQLEKR